MESVIKIFNQVQNRAGDGDSMARTVFEIQREFSSIDPPSPTPKLGQRGS
jgi:hypothetical protein